MSSPAKADTAATAATVLLDGSTPPPPPRELLEKMILLLAGGLSHDSAAALAVSKMDLTPSDASALVSAAARRIDMAAHFDRESELGLSVTRLTDCYKKAMATQDIKTALAVQRELNKLLDLYATAMTLSAYGLGPSGVTRPDPSAGDDSAAAASAEQPADGEDAARLHLSGLIPGALTLPLGELLRRAALRIMNPTIAEDATAATPSAGEEKPAQ